VHITPNYSYKKREYRIVGMLTTHVAPSTEQERVESIAGRALAALLAKLGAPYSTTIDGKRTSLVITHNDEQSTHTTPATGRFRVLCTQPPKHVCAYCDRAGSVKWGGQHACTQHAEHEGVVWDAVRRTRAAAQRSLGDGYSVAITLNVDPRNHRNH